MKFVKTHKIAPDELKLIVKDVIFVFMPLIVSDIEIFVVGSSQNTELSLISIKDQLSSTLVKVIE